MSCLGTLIFGLSGDWCLVVQWIEPSSDWLYQNLLMELHAFYLNTHSETTPIKGTKTSVLCPAFSNEDILPARSQSAWKAAVVSRGSLSCKENLRLNLSYNTFTPRITPDNDDLRCQTSLVILTLRLLWPHPKSDQNQSKVKPINADERLDELDLLWTKSYWAVKMNHFPGCGGFELVGLLLYLEMSFFGTGQQWKSILHRHVSWHSPALWPVNQVKQVYVWQIFGLSGSRLFTLSL